MAKQYKTQELVNTWIEGERGEFVSNNSKSVFLLNDCIAYSKDGSYPIALIYTILNAIWTKVQKPVTFMEAINSDLLVKPESSSLGYNRVTWWLRHLADNYSKERIK